MLSGDACGVGYVRECDAVKRLYAFLVSPSSLDSGAFEIGHRTKAIRKCGRAFALPYSPDSCEQNPFITLSIDGLIDLAVR